ncbi:sigma-70 family RNA polymerase sigma factor [Chitinophaga horti]|uniref:Sigma-70 family RNA polymerase sigma factor n=1 Tax=Chitinophaga horti TaxID=2920382 RepID=A0ABY6J4U6_9BACT|nr:sigma-70 family RNA polymerase sigma factor [Chitinophaga horti]UYQ94700.1 sigma-70 family RNA polymerase sigma factor [Chitinophaga horti]
MDKLQDLDATPEKGIKPKSDMKNKAQAMTEACEELFTTYGPELILYAKALGLDEAQAEDVVLQLFASIWEKKDSLRIYEMTNRKGYLFTSVHNRFLDLRKVDGRQRNKNDQYVFGLKYWEDEKYSEGFDVRSKMAFAMNKYLTEQQRLVVVYTRFEQMSHEEAGAQMGISASTVKKHLKVALTKLRKHLKDLYAFLILLSLLFS